MTPAEREATLRLLHEMNVDAERCRRSSGQCGECAECAFRAGRAA